MNPLEEVRAATRRRWPWLVGGALVVVVGVVGLLVAQALREQSRPLPPFPSMAEEPQLGVNGTVAYYDGATACVRIMDVARGGTADAYCLDSAPDSVGPVTGPHLSFRADGRLEVTAFEWPPNQPMSGAWQVVVDLTTGEVERIPDSELPDQPTSSPIPAVGPGGEELTAEVHDQRLTIDLLDDGEVRRLLESDKGPADYFVGNGGQPVWSPSGDYVVLFDGRLLLTTVDDPSTTRILVDYSGPDGFGCCWSSSEIRRFAVTDRTYLDGPRHAAHGLTGQCPENRPGPPVGERLGVFGAPVCGS